MFSHTTLATRMEFSLPPPTPFLSLPGEPPVPWIRWLESFETYLAALGLEEASDPRRRALLVHCLGTEGQRIFRTLGQAKKYKEATKLLEADFADCNSPPDSLPAAQAKSG